MRFKRRIDKVVRYDDDTRNDLYENITKNTNDPSSRVKRGINIGSHNSR